MNAEATQKITLIMNRLKHFLKQQDHPTKRLIVYAALVSHHQIR